MNKKYYLLALVIAAWCSLLILGCSEELYDIAKNAESGFSEVFALADRGGDLVLLRATQSDVREYAVMGGSDVFWSAGLFLQVSGDGTAWVAFRDTGIPSWVIYRSEGADYSNWIKMSKEFDASGQVSAITAAGGKAYMIYSGVAGDEGLWEFYDSGANYLANFPDGRAICYSRDDNVLYMTVNFSVVTEIHTWNLSMNTYDSAYNTNANAQINSFFAAKFGSEFFIGYFNRLIYDPNNGLTVSFPNSFMAFDLNYTIQSFAIVYGGVFAAAVNSTIPSADILSISEVTGLFEVFRNISGESGIDIKLLYLGGSNLAVGIRGSSEANGLHLYDYSSDELKNLAGYDVYDISVRQ